MSFNMNASVNKSTYIIKGTHKIYLKLTEGKIWYKASLVFHPTIIFIANETQVYAT